MLLARLVPKALVKRPRFVAEQLGQEFSGRLATDGRRFKPVLDSSHQAALFELAYRLPRDRLDVDEQRFGLEVFDEIRPDVLRDHVGQVLSRLLRERAAAVERRHQARYGEPH